MRKKKVLFFGITFLLAFVFTGCAADIKDDGRTYKGQTGAQIYKKIMTDFADYESNYTMGIDMTMAMKAQSLGMTTNQNIAVHFDYCRESMEKEYYREYSQTFMDGDTAGVQQEEHWRFGRTAYHSAMEEGFGEINQEKTKETLESYEDLDGIELTFLELPTMILQEMTFSIKEDDVVLSGLIDMDSVSEGMEGIFELIGSLGDFSLGMSVEISNMLVEVYLTKDCRFKRIDFSYSMQAGMFGGLLGSSYGDTMISVSVKDLGCTVITQPVGTFQQK